jgi:hypothetical protein
MCITQNACRIFVLWSIKTMITKIEIQLNLKYWWGADVAGIWFINVLLCCLE